LVSGAKSGANFSFKAFCNLVKRVEVVSTKFIREHISQAIDGNITSTFNIPTPNTNKKFLKVTDLLGREIKQTNQPLFYIYDDGTVEKRIVIE
jgi:hypothetical protein